MLQLKNTQVFEDFVVILQKLSTKDPITVRSLLNNKVVEVLNSEMTKNGGNEFVVQNIKSIFRNIKSDHE